MVHMPAEVVGWRPIAQSWLDQYLAGYAAATHQAGCVMSAETEAVTEQPPSAEPSQLETPGSPTLPGFGKPGGDSFNPARAAVVAGRSSSASSLHCPEQFAAVKSFLAGMFEKCAEPLLQWVATKGMQIVPTSAAALVTSTCTILKVQLDGMLRSVCAGISWGDHPLMVG